MEVIFYTYLVFALSITALSCTSVYMPVIETVYDTDPKPQIVRTANKWLLLVVLAIIALFIAPFMLYVLVNEERKVAFMDALTVELQKS